MTLQHHEIEELLGAYALDAVDRDEADLVERHLAECPRCRAEVEAHREVAAFLTSGAADPAPAGVWDRIAADLGDTPPPVPIEVVFGQRRADRTVEASPRRNVLVGLSAAAAVLIIAALGTLLVNQGRELEDTREELAAARQADDETVARLLADADTQVVSLNTDHGETGARALVGEDGDSVLLAAGLPALGTGQTYQLWGLPRGEETMVSLGVLGSELDRSEFHIDAGLAALAVSREPGGGSTEPTTDPVVVGSL